MAFASSSALRDESADGPAYGSLTGLGGARAFKKKPVLVLDPEELAAAHLMFQEASAEMLGQEIERPERTTTVLGLAGISQDDEPDDMGASDELADGAEDDLPNPDEMLALSRLGDDEHDYEASAEGRFDEEKRIFPNLPLVADLDHSREETPPQQLRAKPEHEDVKLPEPGPAAVHEEPVSHDVAPRIEDEPEGPFLRFSPRVEPEEFSQALGEPAVPKEPGPLPRPPLELSQRDKEPAQEIYELDREEEQFESAFTLLTEEEEAHGYAFMQGAASRRISLDGAQPGINNSLRARLIREAEAEPHAEESPPPSLLQRIKLFMRGLFG